MRREPLSLDTSPEIERLQIERWRQMSPAEKAAIVSGLTQAVYALALAGVRSRHPGLSPRDQFLRLATMMLGPDLARRAYPEVTAQGSPLMLPIDPIAVALSVTDVFEALGIVYTIGGSLASSFAGEPRSTVDIDIVAALEESHIPALVPALSADFYVDAEALRRAVRERASTNLIHQSTQLKVDIFVAGGTPLDEQQLLRRQAVTIEPGRTLYLHPPEDILLQKLHWYRKGGEISDRQWLDIVSIVRVQGPHLDRAYLVVNAPVLGVADLLARALAGC